MIVYLSLAIQYVVYLYLYLLQRGITRIEGRLRREVLSILDGDVTQSNPI